MRVLTVVALWLTFAAPVLACSCFMSDGSRSDHVRRGYGQATSVFSAYVESVYYTADSGERKRMAKLRVLQVWKGDLAPNSWLAVESDADTGLGCGLAVEPDTAILAYTTGPALVSCSMTGPLHKATQDIPLLNKLAGRSK